MSDNIQPLDLIETPQIQTEALVALQASVGLQNSKDMVDRAVFEMADRLWVLKEAVFDGDFQNARRVGSSLAAVSAQIGLCDFARVARDLTHCIDVQDWTSISAVHARLQRVGAQSLYDATEFQKNA